MIFPPTHPSQNAYHTELGIEPGKLMAVDILHDFDLGAGGRVVKHNVRIFHSLGREAVNTFDTR